MVIVRFLKIDILWVCQSKYVKILRTFYATKKQKISISNESSSRKLGEILDKNHFYLKANQAIEKSFALGFGAFVLSADSKFGIRIQFITADNIIPLEYDNNFITECAFMSDSYDIRGEKNKIYSST